MRKRFVGPSQGNAASWVQRGLTRPALTRATLSFLSLPSPCPLSSPLSPAITAHGSFLRLMDHHNLIRNIFSRNTSPPNSYASPTSSLPSTLQSYPEEQSQPVQQFQHVSPAQSLKDVAPSPPAQVESLFSNLTSPGQSSANPNPPLHGSVQYTATAMTTSGPTSPASSLTALSAPSNMSTSTNTPPNLNPPGDSRQSTLLSLMSSVSPAGSSSGASGAPQQVPTPPGHPNRTGPASVGSNASASINNESQGRLLLEQLMAG